MDFNELLSAAAFHYEQNRRFFPMYLHLLASSLFPIYTGAYASLSRPSSAAKPTKGDAGTNDDNEEETVQKMEGLTPKDAIVFPLMAGIVLSGLYWLIKTYGAGSINTILGIYFSLIGTYSVGKLINDSWATLAGFLTPDYYRSNGEVWKVQDAERKAIVVGGSDRVASRTSPFGGVLGAFPLPESLLGYAWAVRGFTKEKFLVKGYMQDLLDFRLVLTRHNVASSIFGVAAIGYSLFVGKPWWLTNLQGFAVSYGALQLMSPTTFATGTLILTGLFFYDIWAVFFTPLMVTVAKNLDVPIKLVFPRPNDPNQLPDETVARSYSMLGLGDIVLPGLVIALALRFDLYMFYLRKQKTAVNSEIASGAGSATETVEKAPYVSVSGHWAEKLLTAGRKHSALPAYLSSSFPTPYFNASLVGYVIGMLATLICMSVFHHAQPALLYLVPGVLISTWGTGLVRGELKHMWEYTEAINAEPVDDGGNDEEQNEQQEPEEAGSFFSKLWKEIFGDSSKETNSSDTKQEIVRPADVSKDAVFSFTVSRHSPQSHGGSAIDGDGNTGPGDSKTAMRASRTPDTSSDDDAVLVGRSNLGDEKKLAEATRLRSGKLG